MTLEEKILKSQTKQVRVVFKSTTNDYNTLFGGFAMKWMDEVAYITATRFIRKKVVTISTGGIKFNKPIPYGAIVELIGTVAKVGNVRLEIKVEVYTEQMYTGERQKAFEGSFFFAAVDENHKLIRLTD